MTKRNAQSRPHCVDLAPSVFRGEQHSQAVSANERQPAAKRFGSRTNRSVAATPTGAVRRSGDSEKQGSTHLGKLAAAAVVVAGAVVWTTGSSQPLTAKLTDKPETIKAAVAPAFYFNDYLDALERTHGQTSSDIGDAGLSNMVSEQSPAIAPADVDDFGLNTDTTVFTPSDTDQDTTRIAMVTPTTADRPASAAIQNITEHLNSADVATSPQFAEVTEQPLTRAITVARGDTLSGILNRNGLKVDQMHELLTNELVKKHLSNIDIGQQMELTHNESGEFDALTLRVGNDTRVNISRSSTGFDVVAIDLPIEKRRMISSGQINQSLYLAAEQANLKQSTIMELANIFQWELDFARDIRQGDQFSLVYDRLYREGEYVGDGDILAAEFIRGGKSYKAIRFTTTDGETGYYSPEGQSKRRTFMRHPVDVVRITSKFNPNRLHPVLHQIRAHRGVDYGSPHGSPIYATADGTVSFSGSKNAYGKTVVLKHGEKFSTLYAHMSRISSKSVKGKRVKQGDVIGYVGNTGRVTGTHLHYEFRVYGKQIDPLKVELPAAQPLAAEYLTELQRKSDEMSVLLRQAFEDMDRQMAATSISLDDESQSK